LDHYPNIQDAGQSQGPDSGTTVSPNLALLRFVTIFPTQKPTERTTKVLNGALRMGWPEPPRGNPIHTWNHKGNYSSEFCGIQKNKKDKVTK
jgi:hypothetical protein